jgi:hypothetical protein
MGAVVGIAILASIFLLPFSSSISIISGSLNTLYNTFNYFVSNLGSIPNVSNTSLELIAYLYLVGTVLLLASGLTGSFPFFSGVSGIVGMVMMTMSGTFSPQYTFYPLVYGLGFYLLWALPLAQLVMYAVSKRTKVNLTVTSSSVPGPVAGSSVDRSVSN